MALNPFYEVLFIVALFWFMVVRAGNKHPGTDKIKRIKWKMNE